MSEKNPSQKRAAEIAGVCCLALAIFFLLAFFSYHPLDPSFTHYDPGTSLHNLTGSIGAYTADTLIKLMGIGIFWLPVMLIVTALRYLREPQFRIGGTAIVGLIGLVFTTSGMVALLIGNFELYGVSLHAGGLLGKVTANLLNANLRLAGSLIVLALIIIITLMILFDFSVVNFVKTSLAIMREILTTVRALIEHGRKLFREKPETTDVNIPGKPQVSAPLITETLQETLKEKLRKACLLYTSPSP